MAYNKNVPQIINNISQDLTQMQENFSRLGDLIINQSNYPTNPDDGQLALVNKKLVIYDATSGRWNGLNFFGFKNRIINGDFSVWQRGTSFTFGANQSGYTADRWKHANLTDGQFTVSKSTLNNKNAIRITVDIPPTDLTLSNANAPITYLFEGQHLYDLAINGKTITISFWFNSNVTGEFSVALINETYHGETGTWDTTQYDSYVTTFNYTTANIPQKIIITIPLNHTWTTQPVNSVNRGFKLVIANLNQGDQATSTLNTWLSGVFKVNSTTSVNWASATGNFIEIAEVQLEEGDVATDFEYVPYDIQLLRCMRYYFVTNKDKTVRTGAFDSLAFSPNNLYDNKLFFPVPMRTIPTIKFYASISGTPNKFREYNTGTDVGTPTLGVNYDNKMIIIWDSSGSLTQNYNYGVHIEADAEL